MNSETTNHGLGVFRELLGDEAAALMEQGLQSEDFASDLSRLACDHAFSSVWGRDGLEKKQRSLVVIGVLIAQRQHAELKNHIRIGLNNGLTAREIEEALIQTLPYCGFPAVASATGPIIEVLRERGIDTTTRTPHERGTI